MHLFTIYGNISKTQEMNRFPVKKKKKKTFPLKPLLGVSLILFECYLNVYDLKFIDIKALMLIVIGQLKKCLKLNPGKTLSQ